MNTEDYYALVNYRGKTKYYHITASLTGDKSGYEVRMDYIDYNPNREYGSVWIKDSKNKILKIFDSTTLEYKYFNALQDTFMKLIKEEESRQMNYYNLNYLPWIGTHTIFKLYKRAVSIVPNQLNIII